jgi:hypothetical protein
MKVAVTRAPDDAVAASVPVTRAIARLQSELLGRGIVPVDDRNVVEASADVVVTLCDAASPAARSALGRAGIARPAEGEAFCIVADPDPGGVTACGADARGLVYAVLELVDRLQHVDDPVEALRPRRPLVEQPTNRVRSVARLFCSETADLEWFRHESFWRRYLSMLVAQRFNRVSLTLGLGYNFHRGVTDAYLYFAHPFLVDVPRYTVVVPQLRSDEREANLAALRFASAEAEASGLEFQLGLWTHAFEWIDSPSARHTIEGLTPDTHARYCRDALARLLDECPAVSGVTFRVHGESGVPERSWDFWRTVFEAVRDAGRPVRIDLHAKGLDAETLRAALSTGQPVTVSPKFWAEHMGLPYHQAAIRELERAPRPDPSDRSEWHRYMALSEGSRSFTRYGYADLLREDRPYDVVFRLWPGTQRLLLWGDPAFAAGYGRAAGLAGAAGLEWCEPLSFKAREGSDAPGSRVGYADPALAPADDFEKYLYTYRLFGRLTYDPDADPDTWRRQLRTWFGEAAKDAEASLAAASRILPLVTTAHHPSASNNYYWPEMYTDMPIVPSDDGADHHPYIDTPAPRRFGTVSPLDPEVFSSVVSFVREARDRGHSGRVSPLDVAAWLDHLAQEASLHADAVERGVEHPGAEIRRWVVDVRILAALGRFFAGKLRAAVAFERHVHTGDVDPLDAAVDAYHGARTAWVDAMTMATGVYVRDLAFGPQPWLRGHWADRLAAIDADLDDMRSRLATAAAARSGANVRPPVGAAYEMGDGDIHHVPPPAFRPGTDLPLEVWIDGPLANLVRRVRVRYRPMHQGLPYSELAMERAGERFCARIPGSDLTGGYPLAYAFVVHSAGGAWRVPGLGGAFSAQPYHIVRREDTGSSPTL